MLTFHNIENLILILLTALWAIVLIKKSIAELQRRRQLFATSEMLSRVAGHKPTQRPAIKWAMIFVALSMICLAMIRPQGDMVEEEVSGEGLDLVVALDISKSMNANDIDGNTRLDVSKAILSNMIQGLKRDRLGLVVFAGETMVQSPISYDKAAFLTFLNRVNPELLAKQGTNLASAIQTSIDRFDMTASQTKVILLISDGEDQNEKELDFAINEAAKKNIQVFTLGVGSKEGGRIPVARDWMGRLKYKVHKGRVVVTKLNERSLKHIAKETSASYFRAYNISSAKDVIEKLSKLKRITVGSTKRLVQKELYTIPVFLAFFLLLIEFVISERVHYEREHDHWLKRI